MSLALGAMLGVGLLLVLAPRLWPAKPVSAAAVGGSGVGRRIRDDLALAGLGQVPIAVVVIVALVLSMVLGAVVQSAMQVPTITAVAALLGAAAVPLAIASRADRRRAANRAVWPDVVDHLVASVRSGVPLPESVGALGTLGPAQTRSAFAAFEADYRRTGNFSLCLDRLKAVLADPIADRILETLRMAREVGGTELTTVLRALSGYLRDDAALRAEVVARQSWIRNAARLGVAAPWLLLVVLSSRHETMVAYDSPAGAVLLVVGVIVTVVAYQAMTALGRLPEERRWFR
ncbi:tight adherence protein B [Agromyces sp. CF514]|uniref:type II secretion system F family protein n=1 Tax=Agromyces sp. CF514 TaxID=1881031 RepID=UPI0008EE8ED4|nr:type II secretion system F family protein [Agromyces sp. CF514]SFR74832.1 tight adherence protein B [Agromyces sp. CF514]